MKPWTPQEDEVLVKYSMRGAAECQRQLAIRCRSKRTVVAIQRRGSRIGVSFQRYEVCPHCNRAVPKLNPYHGLCARCSAYRNRDRALDRKRQIQEAEREGEEVRRVNREYNAARRWVSRH